MSNFSFKEGEELLIKDLWSYSDAEFKDVHGFFIKMLTRPKEYAGKALVRVYGTEIHVDPNKLHKIEREES